MECNNNQTQITIAIFCLKMIFFHHRGGSFFILNYKSLNYRYFYCNVHNCSFVVFIKTKIVFLIKSGAYIFVVLFSIPIHGYFLESNGQCQKTARFWLPKLRFIWNMHEDFDKITTVCTAIRHTTTNKIHSKLKHCF